MKRTTSLILTLILILSCLPISAAASTPAVGVIIDGVPVVFTDDSGYPFVNEDYRTMVPLRVTMESAGAAVGYDSKAYTAIVIAKNNRIEVPIGTDYLYNNYTKIQNDTTSVAINGRTYLPIRAVLEAAGCTVDWDSSLNAVIVTTNSATQVEYTGDDLNTSQYVTVSPPPSTNPGTTPSGLVWIPKTGSKYHRTSTCSSMKNPSQVSLETATSRGYTACSKCW